jgi:hypothetical protein
MITSMLAPEARARVEAVLTRAAAEPAFLASLTTDPAGTLAGTPLTADEKALVAGLRRVDLEEVGVDVRPFRHVLVHDACLRTTGRPPR